MARFTASSSLVYLVSLQILFTVVIPIVTSTKLDGDSCYLNLSGNVCDFAYVTSGISLLFSLLLAAGTAATLRAARAAPHTTFLPAICGSLAAFATFWWLVTAVTITQRGGQASNAGLPAGSARNGVIALSWLEFVLFLAATLAVSFDRVRHARQRSLAAHAAEQLLTDEASSQQSQGSTSQFKQASFELSMPSVTTTHTTPTAPLATAV